MILIIILFSAILLISYSIVLLLMYQMFKKSDFKTNCICVIIGMIPTLAIFPSTPPVILAFLCLCLIVTYDILKERGMI